METIPAEIVVTLLRYSFRGDSHANLAVSDAKITARWRSEILTEATARDMLAIGRATGRMVIFSQDTKTRTVTADFVEIKTN